MTVVTAPGMSSPSTLTPTASPIARVAAFVAGVVILGGGVVISAGGVLLAPITMAAAAYVKRRRGDPLTRLGHWIAACSAMAIVIFVAAGALLSATPKGTVANVMRAVDSSSAVAAKQPPPAWLERLAPGYRVQQRRTAPSSHSAAVLMAIFGIGFAVSFFAALYGSLGWGAGMLLGLAARGRWPGAAASTFFIAACVSMLGAVGCVIPVNIKEPASPDVVGVYERGDGSGAPARRVAISPNTSRSACAKAGERFVTDSVGHFQLPATTSRRRWLLLLPPMESWWNSYALCAGSADTLLEPAYEGIVPLRNKSLPDTVRCLEWEWRGRLRTTCSGPRAGDALQSGGRWLAGDTAGFYRLIVAGRDKWLSEPGVFLQWVQRRGTDEATSVRETVELPIVEKSLLIEEATLHTSSGHAACVSLRSRGSKRHWYSGSQNVLRLSLELGPPGQVQQVPSCPS